MKRRSDSEIHAKLTELRQRSAWYEEQRQKYFELVDAEKHSSAPGIEHWQEVKELMQSVDAANALIWEIEALEWAVGLKVVL